MSSGDDPALRMKVEVDGAQEAASGLNLVGDAAKKVDQATAETGNGAREASTTMREFLRSGGEAKRTIDELERASQGGIQGLFGLAGAMRSFIGFVRTAIGASGPMGLLVVVLGTIIGLFLSLRHHSEDAADGIKKSGDATEELKKKTEELAAAAKKQADTQLAALKEINKEYDTLIDSIDQAAKHTEAENAATLKLAQAKLEAGRQTELGQAKTPEDKDKINSRYDLQKEQLAATNQETEAIVKQGVEEIKIKQLKQEIAKQEEAIAAATEITAAAEEKKKKALQDSARATREQVEAIKATPGTVEDTVRTNERNQLFLDAEKASAAADKIKAKQAGNIAEAEKVKKEKEKALLDATSGHTVAATEVETAQVEGSAKEKALKNAEAEREKKAAEENRKKAEEQAAQAERQQDESLSREQGQEDKNAGLLDRQAHSLELDVPGNAGGGQNTERATRTIEGLKNKVPPPLDGSKLAASVGGYHEKVVSAQTGNKESLDGLVKTVDGLKGQIPPPLDAAKLAESMAGYHQKVIALQTANQAALDALAKVELQQAQEISQLSDSIKRISAQVNLLAQQAKNSRS